MLFRAQQLAGFRFAKNEARRTVAVSAKEPGWPKHESIRFESSGHRERAALVRLQGNLLGQHDIPDGQVPLGTKQSPSFGRPRPSTSQTFVAAPAKILYRRPVSQPATSKYPLSANRVRCSGDSHCRRSRSDRPSGVLSAPCLMKRALTALRREDSPGRDGAERNMALPAINRRQA